MVDNKLALLLNDYLSNSFPNIIEFSYLPTALGWRCIYSIIFLYILFLFFVAMKESYKLRYKFEAKHAIKTVRYNDNVEKELYEIIILVMQYHGIYKPVFGRDFLKLMDKYYTTSQVTFEFNSKIGDEWLCSILNNDFNLSLNKKNTIYLHCFDWVDKLNHKE